MSSLDHRQNSATEQYNSTTPLSSSGSSVQQAPVEQLPFPDFPAIPGIPGNSPIPPSPATNSGADTASQTQLQLNSTPATTRALTEVNTDALSVISSERNTTTLR